MVADNPDRDLIASLGELFRSALRPFLLTGRVALLDFPSHRNVGDSLIWRGERAALRGAGVRVTYSSDNDVLRAGHLYRRNAHNPVLLHGGGNFGDVWPGRQLFREQALNDLRASQVVQLPQTIHFGAAPALAATRRAVEAHPQVTLFTRDERSRAFAARHFPTAATHLVPDAAFSLGPRPRPVPDTDVLCLVRDDRESARVGGALGSAGLESVDWGSQPFSAWRWRAKQQVVAASRRAERPPVQALGQAVRAVAFDRLARQNDLAGMRTVGRGRVVVTDRLHGHILCMLMGIPHVLLDNVYGKIGDFHDTWTRGSRLTHVAATAPEAVEIARRLCA